LTHHEFSGVAHRYFRLAEETKSLMLTFRTAGHWSPITFLPYIGGITLSGKRTKVSNRSFELGIASACLAGWEINMADRKSRAISHSVVLFRVG
jgi:hypothetical protein